MNMASSTLKTPVLLKSKLDRVHHILEDANKRLQEEANKHEIFTTKTSAGNSSFKQSTYDNSMPNDLIRTISDITTLKSVLACPIFNRIVNVTDSLDQLSYDLNLHPSIGPADINIDANGELILAPPIELSALNNHSPQISSPRDSGASSYQSQATKEFSNATEEVDGAIDIHNDSNLESMEQELVAPEMEHIEVTLEKDDNGLGITIAGYTCETTEISGVFIKNITPNSPADRCGKIRLLDQIFAVNGRELLGYSNPDAVNALRQTGKVVTLRLMRYLAENKYKRLQDALANALPRELPGTNLRDSPVKMAYVSKTDTAKSTEQFSSYKSSSNANEPNNEQPMTRVADIVSSIERSNEQPISPVARNHFAVPSERAPTSRVIETKQGARNTIDLKSPVNRTVAPASAPVSYERPGANETSRLHLDEPEWESKAQIVELTKDNQQGLGFTVKDYANPKDTSQSIIMITHIAEGGVAERNGELSVGDLLIFVDDTSLEGASLAETVKALKRASGRVRLGVLKVKTS